MKTQTGILALTLALMATSSFAAGKVKSKLGDLDLTKQKDGGGVVCTARFSDEMTLLREAEMLALVKANCGQGWVAKSKIEYVAAAPGDNSFTIGEINIQNWIDNQTAFGILNDNIDDFETVTIDRDFREYLQHTLDREQMEMGHAEN
ncbi:MAG: hypothetical protein HUK19_03230 [Fibrobacter sp.]|nr:hypothetical protein [Fibrobacter sp.]